MPMSGYTKLFNSILASTIWEADMPTRIVWITLLAMADKNGVAEGSLPGLATFARVPLEDCRKAVEALMAPDPDSRSKEANGRRIEAVEGGWRLINHAKYRQKLSSDERREYLRQKQAEYRRKQKSTKVNNVSDKSTLLTHTKAEATTDTTTKAEAEGKNAARSKRPIYTSDRFAVFEWQLDELSRTLGKHFEAFDLHAFFDMLSQQSRDSGLVIPRADAWPWVQAQVLAEAKRRKLPIASSEVVRDVAAERRAQDERILAEIQADKRYAGH